MRTIWKYPLGRVLALPDGARLIKVARQAGELTLWALVDTEAPLAPHHFEVCGTGHPAPPDSSYVGTVFDEPFVWHVFEVPQP